MHALMMGTGPIGGIVGRPLVRGAYDISFVGTDKEHVAAIREIGLQVDVPDEPFNIILRIALSDQIEGKFDTVFMAVRSDYAPSAPAITSSVPDLPKLLNSIE